MAAVDGSKHGDEAEGEQCPMQALDKPERFLRPHRRAGSKPAVNE